MAVDKTIRVPASFVQVLWELGVGAKLAEEDDRPLAVWEYIAEQELSKGRWHTWKRIILEDPNGDFWGVDYGEAATEYQEHELPWRWADDGMVELMRLEPKPVTTIVYEPWK